MAFTTLLRPEPAARLIESVLARWPGVPIHGGIQGELPALVERFQDHPLVHLHKLEFDAGLSRARNELFERISRPFILILDDDMVVRDETGLQVPLEILKAHPDVGIVGGRYLHEFKKGRSDPDFVPSSPPSFEFFIEGVSGGVLRLQRLSDHYGPAYKRDREGFYDADVVHNVALLRRQVVVEGGARWDDRMKVGGEHLDFYLNIHRRQICRVAFHAGLAVDHYRDMSGDYDAFRGRPTGMAVFLRKWRLYKREIAGREEKDYRIASVPRRAKGERLGFGEGRRAIRRIVGPRLRHLARPDRMARTLVQLGSEERYRRAFVRNPADPFLSNVFLGRNWMFVQASKCACTFVKSVLDELEHGPAPYHHRMDVHVQHRLDSGLSMPPREIVRRCRSPQVFRFGFTRNPYPRILSAYLDKFGDPSRRPYLPAVAIDAYIRHHRWPPDAERSVSFREFLHYVASQPRRTMDRHWRPVHDALLLGRVRYDFLGRVEHLTEHLELVLARLGAPESTELAKKAPSNVTNARGELEGYYDGECIDLVRRIYREDFVSFGYSHDPADAISS